MKFLTVVLMLLSLNAYSGETLEIKFNIDSRSLDTATEIWTPITVLEETVQIKLEKEEVENTEQDTGMVTLERKILGVDYSILLLVSTHISPTDPTKKSYRLLTVMLPKGAKHAAQAAVEFADPKSVQDLAFVLMGDFEISEAEAHFNFMYINSMTKL